MDLGNQSLQCQGSSCTTATAYYEYSIFCWVCSSCGIKTSRTVGKCRPLLKLSQASPPAQSEGSYKLHRCRNCWWGGGEHWLHPFFFMNFQLLSSYFLLTYVVTDIHRGHEQYGELKCCWPNCTSCLLTFLRPRCIHYTDDIINPIQNKPSHKCHTFYSILLLACLRPRLTSCLMCQIPPLPPTMNSPKGKRQHSLE